jgi:aspartyl-tRNA(Asn)/glutamyl-tRNA(Gln) amidotransferase subunit A
LQIAKTLYGVDEKDFTSIDVELGEIKESKPQTVSYLNCFEFLDDYVSKEYQNFLDTLTKQGINLKKVELNLDLLNAIKPVYDIISFSEASSNLSNLTGVHFGKRVEGTD